MRDSVIGLVGIDVDGTLVGTGGIVHPSVWIAAERARGFGIHLALCSGRGAFGTALDYAKRLDSTGWHIFQNGASVLHLGTGRSRSIPLPPDCIKMLIAQARRTGETLELYNDKTYVTESTTEWAREHAQLLGVPYAHRPFDSLEPPIVRAQWLLSPRRADEFMSVRHPGLEAAESTSPLMPQTRFVGMTTAGVSKGSAMRSIASEYNIKLQNVMYVGDAGNDLSALRIVGHPVAMANADPAVIEAAKHTVGDVNQGGLAQALELAVAAGARSAMLPMEQP